MKSIRYTSTTSLFGIPLVAVATGPSLDGEERFGHARGIVAVGDNATGLVAVGAVARGFFAFGAVSIGAVSSGGVALGALACGGLALGAVAIGGLAAGIVAVGGVAAGALEAAGGVTNTKKRVTAHRARHSQPRGSMGSFDDSAHLS